jgi:hypothetical protein
LWRGEAVKAGGVAVAGLALACPLVAYVPEGKHLPVCLDINAYRIGARETVRTPPDFSLFWSTVRRRKVDWRRGVAARDLFATLVWRPAHGAQAIRRSVMPL